MRRSNWIVKPEDYFDTETGRIAKRTYCWHCGAPVGEEHTATCPHRLKTVVVRIVVEFVERVPESWNPSDYSANRNGTYCAINTFENIDSIITNGNCMCDHTDYIMIREATREDEATFGVFVDA